MLLRRTALPPTLAAHGGELRQAAGAAARAAADKPGVTRLQHDNPRNVRLAANSGSIAAMHYLT